MPPFSEQLRGTSEAKRNADADPSLQSSGPGFRSLVPRPAASVTLGNWLKCILRPQPRPTESETLGRGPAMCLTGSLGNSAAHWSLRNTLPCCQVVIISPTLERRKPKLSDYNAHSPTARRPICTQSDSKASCPTAFVDKLSVPFGALGY